MSKIRSKNTKLDLAMKKILKNEKIEFEMYPKIFGKPDFLVKPNIAIFCDSSFWHGRKWKLLKERLSKGNNKEYWISHIDKNKKRDKVVTKQLKKMGFAVLRFWDDEVFKKSEICILEIKKLRID